MLRWAVRQSGVKTTDIGIWSQEVLLWEGYPWLFHPPTKYLWYLKNHMLSVASCLARLAPRLECCSRALLLLLLSGQPES